MEDRQLQHAIRALAESRRILEIVHPVLLTGVDKDEKEWPFNEHPAGSLGDDEDNEIEDSPEKTQEILDRKNKE